MMCRSSVASGWLLLCIASVTFGSPPDIIMIAIDDLRPMLGCYGDTRVQSPNIDEIARRGVVFDHAYCQYAKCGTSRLSLMTGLRPDSVGVFSNNYKDVARFRKRQPKTHSIARWLKDAGYHTQSFGKIYHDGWDSPDDWSMPSQPGREREMWEVVDARNPQTPTRIADRLDCPAIQSPDVPDEHFFAGRMTQAVLQTLDEAPADKPLFLAIGYRRPHLPFVAPRKYFDLYDPDESWLAANREPSLQAPVMAWFNSDGYVGTAKRRGRMMPVRPDRLEAIQWNGYEMRSYQGIPDSGVLSDKQQIELQHAYAACISYVDAQLGKVLDRLKASDRYRDAILLLWSDHGWHLGEHSAWGKMTNFEVATRVPLVIASPQFASARTESIAELVDLYPTICDLAGIEPPQHLEGSSLVNVLRNPSTQSESIALSQYARFQNQFMGRAIRTKQYRYVAWFDQNNGRVVARELYDHESDPNETENLAEQESHRETVQRLHSTLHQSFHLSSDGVTGHGGGENVSE